MSAAAMKGPVNMPRRKVPPRRDSARARNITGTRVVMKEWRARPNAAAHEPMRNTAPAKTGRDGTSAAASETTSATEPAIIIVTRSPTRATAQPAGRLPTSCPMTSSEAMSADSATSAPRLPARIGMRGSTAPSPIAKRTVGA
ncbi:hypothetical protein QE428_002569 [Microbacterium sp. SORGH_AS 505]|nr:hypothetical protein [Microbacterium sp. SORGH_AS_0505]